MKNHWMQHKHITDVCFCPHSYNQTHRKAALSLINKYWTFCNRNYDFKPFFTNSGTHGLNQCLEALSIGMKLNTVCAVVHQILKNLGKLRKIKSNRALNSQCTDHNLSIYNS